MLSPEVFHNMSKLAPPPEQQSLPSPLPSPHRLEGPVVAQSLARLDGALDWAAVIKIATPWVQAVRAHPAPFWALERLLQEFPISSPQGLALMRLAEALLRVPDLPTILALTADQLAAADFEHTGEGHAEPGQAKHGCGAQGHAGDGLLSQLMARAGALAHHLLPANAESHGLLAQLGARTVAAITLRAVQLLGQQFVLGQSLDEALRQAQSEQHLKRPQAGSINLRFSFDMLGEGARTDADARRYLASYEDAIETIAAYASQQRPCVENDGISIKLSALHPRFEAHQRQRVMSELLPRVWHLCQRAAQANIPLTIDAEECERLEITLDVLAALAPLVAQHHPQWPGLGLAVQAYQTRALDVVNFVVALARQHRLRLMVRLVKGAYWDTEIKRAQTLGLPHYPVFTHKSHTDVSYLACARALLDAPDAIYPQFATHNAATIAAVLQLAAGGNKETTPARCELQRLHGMGEAVYREVLKNAHIACRVYAPVGTHRDLLAYLVRRLLENGANASFVHQLADASVSVPALLASPLHPQTTSVLPLPEAIFGPQRRNSAGCDLTLASARAPLRHAYAHVAVPDVPMGDAASVASVYQKSTASYQAWRNTTVAERAAVLRRAAQALEKQTPHFCTLLVKEAHKTWANAIAECREAVDLLRYYADEAERVMQPLPLPVNAPGITGETNELRLRPRGVWVCISPWNFPLAIFIGQVAAALVTGNTVLAKPAEQTPGVAQMVVQLLHAAGVPVDALQLLHGAGETVGAALVAQPGVAGVVFTGSTQVAKIINRALAAQDGAIVPLIAETGGINAMLVDSSALPEQVVDAVVQSSFRSAGQRCSALRLLCVHEGIADGVIEMVRGALKELNVGDPALIATDVGPVIDAEAFDGISAHIAQLRAQAKTIGESPVASNFPRLIGPVAFELNAIADVTQEIFGPVLHVVRWSGDVDKVVAQINALGYGLTLGIQTRIDSRALRLAAAARIGNVYVNRNMIGAVVGVQPFGGEGLSGTGPKAGGPHYLYRFCAEQTVTINTAAAGGNATLLAGGH